MLLKGITDEDFVNYKVPSMFISTNTCSFKCDKESGAKCCQNGNLPHQKSIRIDDNNIIERYIGNPITKAIVFGGLEPFDQWNELYAFIAKFRVEYGRKDEIVIYTGYNYDEIEGECMMLKMFDNIIVKFGRYKPNMKPHFDEVLGITLASDNQYAIRF